VQRGMGSRRVHAKVYAGASPLHGYYLPPRLDRGNLLSVTFP
jgi:hypothetical protein